MPTVTVIVTTYNRKEYLTETIQSILDQTYQDFELIIVDNYSNYDFLALINSFNSEKIIPFQNQNNGIIAVNRNFGIKQAKGEFIAFCDDDDLWVKEKLQLQVLELKNNSADLIYSNTLLFFESGDYRNSDYIPTNSLNRLLFKNHLTTSSVILRNDKLVHFNEDALLIGIEDYELWVKLNLEGFVFKFIKTPLVKYRVIDSSYSRLSRYEYETKIIRLKKSLLYYTKQLTLINRLILSCSILNRSCRHFIFKILNK